MKISLKTLSSQTVLRGRMVLVRVDWNVPVTGEMHREASLKIERSIALLKSLRKRGAKVVVLTHLGRPKKRDAKLSTKHLVRLLREAYSLDVTYQSESVSNKDQREKLKAKLAKAPAGSVHLLENVRFEKGEETNEKKLAQVYAELGDLFINDAFASCHRAHVSVSGIAKILPAYAGPALVEEVAALSRLLDKPKSPFIAVIGGLKLSTKLPLIQALCASCDKVLIGGAMATPFFKAQNMEVGRSVYEKESVSLAKKLLKRKEIKLPTDVVVTRKITDKPVLCYVSAKQLEKKDMIVDVGPHTLKAWAEIIGSASTIVWNGPIGIAENAACGFGSRFIARTIGARAKGKAFGVAGGGDTLPVIQTTKTENQFDFVSTGGGAMLDFIALKGRLPGLMVLMR